MKKKVKKTKVAKTSKAKPKTALDLNEAVVKMASDCNKLIGDSLSGFNPNEKWLVYSRVLNVLFGNHYKMCLGIGQEQVLKKEAEIAQSAVPST